jgi:hypothetical protein
MLPGKRSGELPDSNTSHTRFAAILQQQQINKPILEGTGEYENTTVRNSHQRYIQEKRAEPKRYPFFIPRRRGESAYRDAVDFADTNPPA